MPTYFASRPTGGVPSPHDIGSALSARLGPAGRRIEGGFLELGQLLDAAIQLVERLIGSLQQVSQMLSAETVDQATAALADAISRLGALGMAHERRNGRFEALASGGASLVACVDEMRRTLGYLRAFTVNIKITASGIADVRTEFAAFAEELQAAITQAGHELDEFAAELAELTGQVRAAMRHERELEGHCAETLPALASRLEVDARTIGAHHRRISLFADQVNTLARNVQGRIGAALIALQIGDTTRQRIEHVEAGLRGLADAEDAQARLGPVIYRLLAAQLDDAAAEFGRELDALEGSMTGLACDIGEAFAARGGGEPGDEGQDTLQRLELSLAQALSLAHELEAAERMAERVGSAAERTAGDLADRISSIRTIRGAIQHQAVNAHLKCCRIGGAGKPLSVIAIELRTQVGELDVAANAAETALAALGADPRDATAAHDGGSASASHLLEAAAAPIRTVSSLVSSEVRGLAVQAGQVAHTLRDAVGRLNFRRDVGEMLGGVSQTLLALSAPRAEAGPADAERCAAILAEVARSYTMAREREIHAAFVASLAVMGTLKAA